MIHPIRISPRERGFYSPNFTKIGREHFAIAFATSRHWKLFRSRRAVFIHCFITCLGRKLIEWIGSRWYLCWCEIDAIDKSQWSQRPITLIAKSSPSSLTSIKFSSISINRRNMWYSLETVGLVSSFAQDKIICFSEKWEKLMLNQVEVKITHLAIGWHSRWQPWHFICGPGQLIYRIQEEEKRLLRWGIRHQMFKVRC